MDIFLNENPPTLDDLLEIQEYLENLYKVEIE
jgi:hypothetical protein